MIYLLGLFLSTAQASPEIARLVHSSLVQAKSAEYTSKVQSQNLDLNAQLGTDYPPGTAYGAVVYQLADIPFDKIKAYLNRPGNLLKLVAAVKTQTDVVALHEDASEVSLKLAIKVPVVSNFHTQDRVRFYQDEDGRGVLEWSQEGDGGDLIDNHGIVIAEPAGAKTKLYVMGVHIIKPERRVPWIGRGIATKFAVDHYSNYIKALTEQLSL